MVVKAASHKSSLADMIWHRGHATHVWQDQIICNKGAMGEPVPSKLLSGIILSKAPYLIVFQAR